MMDLNARLEEIRRRSEAMKEARRQRRQLALRVIPLVLCLVLCMGLMMPVLFSSASTDHTGGANGGMPDRGHLTEGEPEHFAGTSYTVTGIHITGKGVDRTIYSPATIARICAKWEQVTAPTPNFSIAGSPTDGLGRVPAQGDPQESYNGKGSPADHYIITFTQSDDSVRSFKLNGIVLTELSTGLSDFLTEYDLQELYGLLGLPVE